MIQVKSKCLIGEPSFFDMHSGTNPDMYYLLPISGMAPNKTYMFTCGRSDNDNYTGTRDYDIRLFNTTVVPWVLVDGNRLDLSYDPQSLIFTSPNVANQTYAFCVFLGRVGQTNIHDAGKAETYGWFQDLSLRMIDPDLECMYEIPKFTYQESEMGDCSINFELKIPASQVVDFNTNMYVEYPEVGGEKFYLNSSKPQGSKDTSSIAYTYNLTFERQTNDLKKRMVRDLVPYNDTYISQGLVFSNNLNVVRFFDEIIKVNLIDCFGPTKWIVDVHSTLTESTTLQSVKIDVSNMYIWDLLLKTFELYGVRWKIDFVTDHFVIKVGHPAVEISHVFKYGGNTGLTKINREISAIKPINRLRGTGGTRNLPINYFSNPHPTFILETDIIEGPVRIKNLMPSCFRTSVQNDDYPLADYVEDSALVAINGIVEDGLEPNENIYPSIEGVYKNSFGNYVEASTPYVEGSQYNATGGIGLINEVVFVEKPLFDDPEYKDGVGVAGCISIATTPYSIPGTSTATGTPKNNGSAPGKTGSGGGDPRRVPAGGIEKVSGTTSTSVTSVKSTENFNISKSFLVGKLNLQYIDQFENVVMPTYVGNVPKQITTKAGLVYNISGTPTTLSASLQLFDVTANANVVGATISMTKSDIDTDKSFQFSGLNTAHTYRIDVTSIADGALTYNQRSGTPAPLTWSTKATLFDIKSSSGVYLPTFDIWVKDIGFNLSDTVADGSAKYASTEDAMVEFTTGDLAGHKFKILAIDKLFASTPDTTKNLLNGATSSYRITLIKSDEEYKSGDLMIPNTTLYASPSVNNSVSTGDQFVFTGIQMPRAYVLMAEQRLNQFLIDQLNLVKAEDPSYTVELFDMFIKENSSIRSLLKGGSQIKINDDRLSNGEVNLYINSLTISYEGLIPKYTISATNKVTVAGSAVQRIQAQIDSLYTGQYTAAQSNELSLLALDNRYLRKNTEDTAYQKIKFKKGLVSDHVATTNFRAGQITGSGAGMYTDFDGSSCIEVDRLKVRKEAVFNSLVISQIKHQGGIVIYSCAAMEVSSVVSISDGYRLFFDTKGGIVKNEFEIDDVIRCQHVDAEGPIKYYSTIVTAYGADFIDISNSLKDGSSLNPEKGDIVVQFGNRTIVNRQSIIEVDVTAGGRQTFFQHVGSGVNPYDLSNKNTIEIGNINKSTDPNIDEFKNMIRVYGDAYFGARNGSTYLKYDEDANQLEIKAKVHYLAPDDTFVDVATGIGNVANDLANVKVGGVNLVPGSYTGLGWNRVPVDGVYTSTDAWASEHSYLISPFISIPGDKEIVVSFDSKDDEAILSRDFYILNDAYGTIGLISASFEKSSVWRKNIFKFKTPAAWGTGANVQLRFDWNGSVGGVEASNYYKNIKLEYGNIATDYSEAPQDVFLRSYENKSYIDSVKTSLQNQIDGNIISWFRTVDPTLENSPSSDWTVPGDAVATEVERNKHANDTCTNTSTGACWRFQFNGTTHVWEWGTIADTATQQALTAAGKAQDTADGKRTTFTITPFIPYKDGDLWLRNQELFVCNTSRTISEAYHESDWGVAVKYTDDTAINNFVIGGVNLLSNSNYELISQSEFCKYSDLAPIFDKYGLVEYTISFDIKAQIAGSLTVYCQNGEGARYSFEKTVDATTSYVRRYVTFTPVVQNLSMSQSMLAFYGNYGSGVKPSIKNVKVELGSKATVWTPAPEDVDLKVAAAKSSADAANTAIGLMSSNDDISPSEKTALNREYRLILDEYSSIVGQANSFGCSSSTYTTAYGYVTAYVGTNLDNLTTNWNLGANGGTVLKNNFNDYYIQRTLLLGAISTAAKTAGVNAAANIVVGGRNFALGTSLAITKSGGNFYSYKLSSKFKAGTYMISFKYNCTTGNNNIGIGFGPGPIDIYSWSLVPQLAINSNGSYSSAISFNGTTETWLLIYTYQYMTVWDVMLEDGNKKSTWVPAVEDVDSDIINSGEGRNFLQNSSFEYNYNSMVSPGQEIAVTASAGNGGNTSIGIYKTAQQITADGYCFIQFNAVPAGTYMFGVDIRSDLPNKTVLKDIRVCTKDDWSALKVIPVPNPIPTTWTRYYVPVTVPVNTGFGFIMRPNTSISNGTIFYDNLMLEKSTKQNTWIQAPEDVQSQINDFSRDDLLQPFEKQALRKEWDILVTEYGWINSQCRQFGWYDGYTLSFANNHPSAWNNFVNYFEQCDMYLIDVLADLETQTPIVGSTLRQKFVNYTSARDRVKLYIQEDLSSATQIVADDLAGMVIGGDNLIIDSYINESSHVYGFAIRSFNVIAGRTYVIQVEGNLDQTAVDNYRVGTVHVWRNDLSYQPAHISFDTTEKLSKHVVFTAPSTETLYIGAYLYKLDGSSASEGNFNVISYSCQEGTRPTNWVPATKYMSEALKSDNATQTGGLWATNLLLLKSAVGGVVTGGFSGLVSDIVGFWTGGTYQQAVDSVTTPSGVASIFRKDGTGHIAGGKILWKKISGVFNLIIDTANFKLSEAGDVEITGKFQSASSGQKVVIDPSTNDLAMYDSHGNKIITIDNVVLNGTSNYGIIQTFLITDNNRKISRTTMGSGAVGSTYYDAQGVNPIASSSVHSMGMTLSRDQVELFSITTFSDGTVGIKANLPIEGTDTIYSGQLYRVFNYNEGYPYYEIRQKL